MITPLGSRASIGFGLGMSRPVSAALPVLNLTATTTGAGQTVTLQRITPSGGTCTVSWGDGGADTTIADGQTTAITHVYASAGTYDIEISNLELIVQVDLRDTKLSGFDTAQLAGNVLTYFVVTAIGSSTIDSGDMVDWRPATWRCYSMPSGGTYAIDSSDMAAWNPSEWLLYSMPAGTYTIDSGDMVDWRPISWYCYSMPSGGTYAIDSSDMAAWNPGGWRLAAMPAGAYTFNGVDFSGWTVCVQFYAHNNNLSQAQVDAILAGHWSAFASRTVNGGSLTVGGTNAAPSGTYQAANPPTTGKEYIYELLNDSQNINPTKKWATVTFTA